jgi:hypothetical protein
VTSDGGKPYQQCRTCRQARRNEEHKRRYRNDPEFREKRRQKSRKWRAAKQQEARDNAQTS